MAIRNWFSSALTPSSLHVFHKWDEIFCGCTSCDSHNIRHEDFRPLIFCNPQPTISCKSLSISDSLFEWGQDTAPALVFANLAKWATMRRVFIFRKAHSKWRNASRFQLRWALIHNEIPGGFTIGGARWTLMRCFWKDELKSALLPGLQRGVRMRWKNGVESFAKWRGKLYWSLSIVLLILLEVWILCDQYPATASLFFCVTYYCRWKARPRTTIRAVEKARPINSTAYDVYNRKL